MEAKDIARLVLKAMNYEASYVEHVDPAGDPCGSYKKTKDQAIREACRGQLKSTEEEAWIGLLNLLLWNDSQDWAKRVLDG